MEVGLDVNIISNNNITIIINNKEYKADKEKYTGWQLNTVGV